MWGQKFNFLWLECVFMYFRHLKIYSSRAHEYLHFKLTWRIFCTFFLLRSTQETPSPQNTSGSSSSAYATRMGTKSTSLCPSLSGVVSLRCHQETASPEVWLQLLLGTLMTNPATGIAHPVPQPTPPPSATRTPSNCLKLIQLRP